MNKLIAEFRRLLNIDPTKDKVEPADSSTQTAAVPGRSEPLELHRGKRRLKENYTSHWDLDYLPREEMEKLIAGSKRDRS
ncbi:MAG: hypothetical protein ACU83N_00720 [Gammaproteobacteria bacterium]